MININNLNVYYDRKHALKNASVKIDSGKITTIIGPNGCGKSTLLKAISKHLKAESGQIDIREKSIKKYNPKELAKIMAFLPQSPLAPDDFTVKELVGFGRHPFLSFGQRLSKSDYTIIDWAITKTDMTKLKFRRVNTLSGGERQRAWIAMALAREPEILLLDEPTTFLDIAHQFEILELVQEINHYMKMTVVMVLHDINQAARYSDEIILMKEGEIMKKGSPNDIINNETMEEIFSLQGEFVNSNKSPYFIPEKSFR